MALEISLGGAGGPGAPRRLLANAPWGVALLVLGLSAIGVWNLASASRSAHAPVWIAQLWWMGAGAVVAAVVVMFDDRTFHRLAWLFYFAVIAMLVLVLVKGGWVKGARRWLTLGPVNIQPSELAKIAVAMALARWFHEDAAKHPGPYGLFRLLVPIGITALPAVLIKRQPDLGTALVVVAVGATVMLFAGVKWKALLAMALAVVVGAALVWPHLQPYQRKRVETFLNPEGDARGAGYHATQSIIAVGSGQGTGKGWGQGTQSLLSFLPEQHTDFIFSVFAEEHGFLGCLVVLTLYLALVLSALSIAGNARDRFGHLLAVGICGLLFWQAAINVSMVIGLLPVVGVPLPLLSYGGSAVLTVFFGLGLLGNVAVRRFVN